MQVLATTINSTNKIKKSHIRLKQGCTNITGRIKVVEGELFLQNGRTLKMLGLIIHTDASKGGLGQYAEEPQKRGYGLTRKRGSTRR